MLGLAKYNNRQQAISKYAIAMTCITIKKRVKMRVCEIRKVLLFLVLSLISYINFNYKICKYLIV